MILGSSAQAQDKPAAEQIKRYWFVMLLRGDNRSNDSLTAAKLQKGHMDNIGRLYYEGKLKVAGPFGDNGDWRGIFIFDAETKEEVDSLLKTDPAIAAGRLKYDIIVYPGGDISRISMKYTGHEKLNVKNGELVIQTSVGEVKELAPFSYQHTTTLWFLSSELQVVFCVQYPAEHRS